MGLPGFVTSITLNRVSQTGQSADGTPTVSTEKVWTKKGHYQQQQGTFSSGDLGYTEYQVYRFWLPFISSGTDRPQAGDTLSADGYEYSFIGIEQESLRHHIIVRAQRVER